MQKYKVLKIGSVSLDNIGTQRIFFDELVTLELNYPPDIIDLCVRNGFIEHVAEQDQQTNFEEETRTKKKK